MTNRQVPGFTLIEIIIVIVIMGVLATLALPRITGQVESIRVAEPVNMFSSIRRAAIYCIDMANATNNAAGAIAARSRCDTWAELAMSPPVGTWFNYASNPAKGANKIQFRATRNGNSVCMDLDVTTGQGQFSVAPDDVSNPYYGIVKRTEGMNNIETCDAVGSML